MEWIDLCDAINEKPEEPKAPKQAIKVGTCGSGIR